MSFNASIKTKYTTITVNEEFDGLRPFYWASVDLAWSESAPPLSKLFAVTMDERLLTLLRHLLDTAVAEPQKDICLDDGSITIALKSSEKHQAARLLGIVEKVEAEFDTLARPQ